MIGAASVADSAQEMPVLEIQRSEVIVPASTERTSQSHYGFQPLFVYEAEKSRLPQLSWGNTQVGPVGVNLGSRALLLILPHL